MNKKLKITLGAALAFLIIAGIIIGNIWTYQNKQSSADKNKHSGLSDLKPHISNSDQCREIIKNHSSYEDEVILQAMCYLFDQPAPKDFSTTDWQTYYDIYFDLTKKRLDKAMKSYTKDAEASTLKDKKTYSQDYSSFYHYDSDIISYFIRTATDLLQLMQIKDLYSLCCEQYNRISVGYTQCLRNGLKKYLSSSDNAGFEPFIAIAQTPDDYQSLMDFFNWCLTITYNANEHSASLRLYIQLKLEKLENNQDIPPLIKFPELSALPLPDGICITDMTEVLLRDVNGDRKYELLFSFHTDNMPEKYVKKGRTSGYGLMIFNHNPQTGGYEPMTYTDGSTIHYNSFDQVTTTPFDTNCSITDQLALEALGL